MANKRRSHKVAERIREVVATLVVRSQDERLNLVTVTAVTISTDLRSAKVYWNVNGGKSKQEEVAGALEKARGYFRRELGQSLDMKFVPEVKFFYDTTLDTMDEVAKLLNKAGM